MKDAGGTGRGAGDGHTVFVRSDGSSEACAHGDAHSCTPGTAASAEASSRSTAAESTAPGALAWLPTESESEELIVTSLERFLMSRGALQRTADQLGIRIHHLCFLKHVFDAFARGRGRRPGAAFGGCIEVIDLKELHVLLGDELSDSEVGQACCVVDPDGTGLILFFEFAEWFCHGVVTAEVLSEGTVSARAPAALHGKCRD